MVALGQSDADKFLSHINSDLFEFPNDFRAMLCLLNILIYESYDISIPGCSQEGMIWFWFRLSALCQKPIGLDDAVNKFSIVTR